MSDSVSKIVLCDRHFTFEISDSEDDVHFSWQVQHFGRVHVHFSVERAALQTCRVECFVPIAMSGLCQVVTAGALYS